MKRLIIVMTLLLFACTSKAQTDSLKTLGDSIISTKLCICPTMSKIVPLQFTDISVFAIANLTYGGYRPLLWFTHRGEDVFLNVRCNFDWDKTVAIYVGKTFLKGGFWITPEAGLLFGGNEGYNGFGPEVLLGGTWGKFSFFSQNQYTISVGKNPDFVYLYNEGFIQPFKRVPIQVGMAGQINSETTRTEVDISKRTSIDLGLTGKVYIKKSLWIKPWVTYDPKNKISKLFIGVGYTYYPYPKD